MRKNKEIERQIRRQKGLKLLAEQELKNKISLEIKRRKKISTLRKWRDMEERTLKMMKKAEEEKARQRAEKASEIFNILFIEDRN